MNATAAVAHGSSESLGPRAPSPAFIECQVVGADRFKSELSEGVA